MKPSYSKQKTNLPFKKFKSRSRTWHAASSSNDNLVISFSEDDSESEHEESRAGQMQQKVTTVASKQLQGVKLMSDSQTVPSLKLLKNTIITKQAKGSENSLPVPSEQRIPSRTSTGSRVGNENDAQLLKNDIGNGQEVGGQPQKQVGGLPQETSIHQKEFRSQNLASQSKRSSSSFHGNIHDPGDMNEEIQTSMFGRQILTNPAGLEIDEQEVKRLKLGQNSYVKLTVDGKNSETKRQVSQHGAYLLANHTESHQPLPRTDPRSTHHDVSDVFPRSSHLLIDCENIQRSDSQIVEPTDTNFPSNNNHSRQHEQISLDADIRHNQQCMNVTHIASEALILNMHKLASHIEDTSTKGKTISGSLLDTTNVNQSTTLDYPGYDFMDIGSLMKLEELKDRELEEAQEIRRRCELAERQSLKAYREAQRALMEANDKCSVLYRRRELFSAHLRTLMMDSCSTVMSPGWAKMARTQLETLERAPLPSAFPSSGKDHELVDKDLTSKAIESKSDVKLRDDACDSEHRDFRQLESSKMLLPRNSSSSAFCHHSIVREPDSKSVGVLPSGLQSSSLPDMSTKEDQRNILVCSDSSGLACDDEILGERMLNVDMETGMPSANENAHDFELEATLRSKLCARFAKKPSNVDLDQSSASLIVIKASNVPMGKDNGVQGVQTNLGERSSHNKNNALPGANRLSNCVVSPSMSADEQPRNHCIQEDPCKANDASVCLKPVCILETVSRHMKFMLPGLIIGQRGVNWSFPDQLTKDDDDWFSTRTPKVTLVDSYNPDLVIDPFWPFCMFEIRGRCNDPECQWQHFRDCNLGEQKGIKHTMDGSTVANAPKSSHALNDNAIFIPTYRIGANLIKVENFPSKSLFSRSNWHYWQMSFCTSFLLPLSIQRLLPLDAPVLHGYNTYADDDNNKRQSLSSLGLDQGMVITKGLTDIEQALELAIDFYSTKSNKTLGRKEALSILSRSLEAYPSSAILWIIYLNIYYRKEKDIGEDDMFLLAVQHTEDSYDLWLMYINSRMQFDSRVDAYNEALYTLCHRKCSEHINSEYLSACILDLFLQMVDFFSMSANEKLATSRIHALLDLSKDPDTPASMILIDILSCLVAHDRCIFWICSIYFTVYKSLPQGIVQQFESEKDIPFDIEWPVIQLSSNEKDLAMELMKLALDNLDMNSDRLSFSNNCSQRTIERSAHCMAVSHVRFITAIQGLENSIPLFDIYLNKYPTCVELIKLCAHYRRLLNVSSGFECFEQALDDWPRDTPGIQCLWNQYAGYVMDCNRLDAGEELMVRWFGHFCKAHVRESEEGMGVRLSSSVNSSPKCLNSDGGSSGLVDLPYLSLDCNGFSYNQDDIMFGYLNLFFYLVMQGDIEKAHASLDRALKEATPDYFRHCVMEHSSFCLGRGTALDCISSAGVLTLLNGYLRDIRCFPQAKLLSRRCLRHLKRARLLRLIDTLLGPVSSDYSLVNSVLRECYGPLLLPDKLTEPKKLIDFVEHLMDISPANYKLSISAYNRASMISERAVSGPSGIMFWASVLLVNSIIQSFPVAPEHAWVESANLVSKLGIHNISEVFHQLALSAYPFSKKLWHSYYQLSKSLDGNPSSVVEAAKDRGIELT